MGPKRSGKLKEFKKESFQRKKKVKSVVTHRKIIKQRYIRDLFPLEILVEVFFAITI